MKLQLKRSNVLESGAAKEPTSAQMEYGELAVNYNNGDPAIFIKDSADNIIRIAGTGNISSGDTPNGPVPPSTGNEIGDLFFDTTNNTLNYWDGLQWIEISSSENAADIFVGTLAEINTNVVESTRRNGFLWWNVEDGTLYVWYIDDNTSQWVVAVPNGSGDSGGSNVTISDTAPSTAASEPGDLWWNTVDGRLYIYYEDSNSAQWVDASPETTSSVQQLVAGTNITLSPADGKGIVTINATGGGDSGGGSTTPVPQKVAYLRDEKPSGTHGGSAVVGWQDRTLNTKDDANNLVVLVTIKNSRSLLVSIKLNGVPLHISQIIIKQS